MIHSKYFSIFDWLKISELLLYIHYYYYYYYYYYYLAV